MITVGGRPMLERTVEALDGAAPIVVVGPRRPVPGVVRWTREQPAGGGPLAGLSAGLREVPADVELVAVLAADHPHVTAATVARLRSSVGAAAGAVLVDGQGCWQWLLGVWKAGVLRRAMPSEVHGRSMRALLGRLTPVPVPTIGAEASDVDTPDDLRRAERGG